MPTPAPKEPGESTPSLRVVPRIVREVGHLEGLARRGLQRNGGLRLISLLLAIGLWIFVNAGQRGSLESFNVPVSYRNLPPHMVITSHPPQSVKIEVTGPRTLLSLIDPGRLTLRLDLTGVSIGQMALRVNPEAFNVPRQTTVVGVVPSQIVLDVDQITTRDVPIRVTLSGMPASGYRVSGTDVDPRVTTVRGPSRDLAHLDDVETEPIEVIDATSNLDRRVDLTMPFGRARLDPSEATVSVSIGPIIREKEFRAVPIAVHNNDFPFRLEPAHVNVTVRGPELMLAKLNLRDAAYIDADGMVPGDYDSAIQVTLPDGIELVHQSAMRVRLRLYREKRIIRP